MTEFRIAKPQTDYSLGSLERALGILHVLAEFPGLTLTEVLAHVGSTKGTVFRHLSALRAQGFVSVDSNKRYTLGPTLMQLGHVAHEQLELPKIASGPMRKIRDEFDETVHLGVLSAGSVVHIETMPSNQPLKMAAALGERAWPHDSSLGKCLLAWATADVVDAVIARGLPERTARTLTTPTALRDDLAAVRSRGYSLDDEESGIGVRCLGVPIRGADGLVIAAMSVSGPSDRVTYDAVPRIAARLIEQAAIVSTACGWPGPSSEGAIE